MWFSQLIVVGDVGARTSPQSLQCSNVHKINSTRMRCRYIKTVDSCQNDGGLLNYLQFIYCTIPFRLIPLAMVVLVRNIDAPARSS